MIYLKIGLIENEIPAYAGMTEKRKTSFYKIE